MKCEHKRIRSTNCEFFCLDCGEKLEQISIADVAGKNQTGKPADESGAGKSTAKKRTPRNGQKS